MTTTDDTAETATEEAPVAAARDLTARFTTGPVRSLHHSPQATH
ncbi:hypothetical protein [Streptomyces sp. NPDC006610]